MKKLEVQIPGFDGDAKLKSHDKGLVPARDMRVRVPACPSSQSEICPAKMTAEPAITCQVIPSDLER